MGLDVDNRATVKLRRHHMDAETIGAIVLGGDYQGLGIVRSLGRKGIPICVIDDEASVARHSRYASFAMRVPRLRHEEEVLGSVLEVGERLGLQGWVLYPTRDEIVAALSRRREELERFFRVPTPPWESISRAWDKRLTYEHARTLGVPSPRTWLVGDAAELDAVEKYLPLVIKPAIKEHFIYATNTRAWPPTRKTVSRRCSAMPPGSFRPTRSWAAATVVASVAPATGTGVSYASSARTNTAAARACGFGTARCPTAAAKSAYSPTVVDSGNGHS